MAEGIETFLGWSRERCERKLNALLQAWGAPSGELREAVSYSLLAGGKRVRPALVYAAAQACGELNDSSDQFACAVEALHCYSLIHDDLPAMDNDELRRGKPTNHKVHGEAMAILAGDVLQSLAFGWLAQASAPAGQIVAAQRVLAQGASRMVSGQALDIAAADTQQTLHELEIMHRNKTGALIEASLMLGGIASGADDRQLNALEHYGRAIGLAFQVKDDILDVEADTATLGKQQGADRSQNKPTYVSLLGLDRARLFAGELLDEARASLEDFDKRADSLRELAQYVVERPY